MEGYPAPQPHADGRDLVLKACALVRPGHPDADAVLSALAAHVKSRQRADDPLLETRDIGPHIGPPPLQVEHDISHPLAGPVIGELSAAPGLEHRKAGIEQVGGLAAGPGGIERGMFQQPDHFRRLLCGDIRDPCLHGLDGRQIGHRRIGYQPLYGAAVGGARECR